MKKLLPILLCFPMIGFGQFTYVPNDNFEQALINLGYDTFYLAVTTTGISDIANSKSKLVKITNMFGQETLYRRNTPLFYLYDNGTVEKRIVIE